MIKVVILILALISLNLLADEIKYNVNLKKLIQKIMDKNIKKSWKKKKN